MSRRRQARTTGRSLLALAVCVLAVSACGRSLTGVEALLPGESEISDALADVEVPDDRFDLDAERQADVRRIALDAELEELGEHPWAGDYFAGDGLSANLSLTLAPRGGFVFTWRGCLGVYDRNYGAVEVDGSNLRLAFTFEDGRLGKLGLAPELTVVRWGGRRYLVPSDDIVGFCNEVNDGSEPRRGVHGRYLLRRGDEALEVQGWPELPAAYRDHLLADDIEAKVIAVGEPSTRPSRMDWRFKDTPLTLNAGTEDGLRVGMELYVVWPDRIIETVTITSIEAHRAEALMTQAGEDEPAPQAGWRFSTRPRWSRRNDG